MLRLAARASLRASLPVSAAPIVGRPSALFLSSRHRNLCSILKGDTTPKVTASSTPEEWLKAYQEGTAPPLRFPIGTPVECFIGGDAADKNSWISGKIVAHNYREESWPPTQLAPYQILLDDKHKRGERNAIWAPADVDGLIRAGFRFKLRDEVEARIEQDEYAKATVVGILYREPKWPEGQYAPYQVKVDEPCPAPVGETAKELVGKLIWLPDDTDMYVRSRSDARDERLTALEGLKRNGVLDEKEFLEKRKEVVHGETESE